MRIKIILLVSIVIIAISVSGHPGGHYTESDLVTMNTWKLKSGKTIKGNFLMGKDEMILIEQTYGETISIPINSLCEQDQKLARFKVRKAAEFNELNISAIKIPRKEEKQKISMYGYLCVVLLITLLVYFKKYKLAEKWNLKNISEFALLSFIIIWVIVACSKSESTPQTNSNSNTNNNNSNSSNTIPKTSTGFIDSAYAPFKPGISTRWDDTYFYIASNGIPNHNMMVGIKSWQQQVPITQPYTDNNSWSIPLQPSYATIPLSTKTNFMKGAVAVAVNGIPIFNALNNRGEDSYLIGELDNWGGHCGRGDDYHYHAAPLHLSSISNLKPIAFALDGFPVYGTKEPNGSEMTVLDSCHGHVGTNGNYHYHGTTNYPYVIGAMRGKVNLDPATPAPENQILPQAFTKPARPATTPLKGAEITDFTTVGSNGYLLTYKIGTKNGYVKYSWDANNKYTYTLTDTSGKSVTTTYQR
jgi:hypothetical protein